MNTLRSLLLIILFSPLLNDACGHKIDQVYMKLSPTEEGYTGIIYIDAAYTLPELRGDRNQEPPSSTWMDKKSEAEHARIRQEAENYFRDTLFLNQNEQPIPYSLSFPNYDKKPYTFQKSVFGAPLLEIHIQGSYLPEEGIVTGVWKDPYDAKLMLELNWQDNTEEQRSILTLEPFRKIELGIEVPALALREKSEVLVRPLKQSWLGFIKVGFDHIVPLGLDHIVFIIGLFLFSPHWRPLLTQSLTFTVAHSVTLALVILGILKLPAKPVEILIALSIFYIAIENLIGTKLGRRRIGVIFGIGLLHGLGFGSVLYDFLPQKDILLPLICFNTGVEIGQITVITACFLILIWFKKSFKYIRIGGSILIAAIGLYWVIQRVIG